MIQLVLSQFAHILDCLHLEAEAAESEPAGEDADAGRRDLNDIYPTGLPTSNVSYQLSKGGAPRRATRARTSGPRPGLNGPLD